MVEVTCKCGKTKKNFKFNVGSFVDECCVAAGYDDLGNLTKKPLNTAGLPTEEELSAEAENLKLDNSPEPEDIEENLEPAEKVESKREKRARLNAIKAESLRAQRRAEKEAKEKAD